MNKKLNISDILKKYNLLVMLLVFMVVSSLISPNFLKVNNFINLGMSSSFIGIIAIGMTFVILSGGIDLSVGSVANFSGMVVAMLLMNGVPVPIAILLAILCGTTLGFFNGLAITYFNIPPFIGSMAMMTAARGLSLLITGGNVVNNLPQDFTAIGSGKFLELPILAWIWIVLTIVAALVLKFTPFGRRIYALGGNKESAYLSGIRINPHSIACYAISGSCAALAGVLMSSYLMVGQPTAIQSGELDAIASVALGGTSLSQGGIGGVIGTFGGVFLMKIITNIFNLTGLQAYYQYIFQGIIIVFALILNKLVINKKV